MEKDRFIGELRGLQRLNKYEFAVELDIMRDGPVQGGRWDFRDLEAHYRSFAGMPILVAYVGKQIGDGHNSTTAYDVETGEEYRSYMAPTAERIVGMISQNVTDLSLVKKEDGYTWIRAKGRIWMVYAPELVEKIVRTGRMDVSAETNILKKSDENGVEVFKDWEGLGVTILGDLVAPAIPGANIRALAALKEEFQSMQLRVASLLEEEEKPQANLNKRELKKLNYLSKQQLKELQTKFGDAHTVLSARQDGSMVTVLLIRNDDLAFGYYIMSEGDSFIETSRIVYRDAFISVELEEGDPMVASAYDAIVFRTAELSAKVKNLSAENEALTAKLSGASTELEGMRTRETARRIKASAEAATRQLAEINANRAEGERFDAELIAPILAAAENGDFAVCESEAGEWLGEERVMSQVRDAAMRKQMEMDKVKSDEVRRASSKRYAFEPGAFAEDRDDDSLKGAYARIVG